MNHNSEEAINVQVSLFGHELIDITDLSNREQTNNDTERHIDAIDTREFIEHVKTVNRLPLPEVTVFYHDDYWDFSGLGTANLSSHVYIFDYQKMPDEYKDLAKEYILTEVMMNRRGLSTISNNFYYIRRFTNYLHDQHCFCLEDVTQNMIIDYFLNQDCSERCKKQSQNAIYSLCCYYDMFIDELSVELFETIKSQANDRVVEAEFIAGKSVNIPEDYFNALLATSVKIMNEENEPEYYRATAALVIIESQIALRTGELFALEANMIEKINVTGDECIYRLKYKTWKRHKGLYDSSYAITYINELTYKAYTFLETLFAKKRKALQTNILYIWKKTPVPSNKANKVFVDYYKYINKYFQTIYDEPAKADAPLFRSMIRYKSKSKPTQYLEHPTTAQFRVHLCSDLYYKGVPIEYIELFMSHLSTTMQGYYARPKHSPQEDMEYSMRVLREIVTKEVSPIGAQKGLIEKIDAFIEENGYDVEKDLDSICRSLAEEIPIRAKTGGVCIKSSLFRECDKDADTTELYCAYGACPNIYSFYYDAVVSLRKARELGEIIAVNRKRGHIKQAQKSEHMLESILTNRLIPELEQLSVAINDQGIDRIVEKHPELSDLIANLSDVKKEINKWKKELELN